LDLRHSLLFWYNFVEAWWLCSLVKEFSAYHASFSSKPQTPAESANFHDNGGPQAMQDNSQSKGFDNNRINDRRDGGMSFFSPIFGLIRLAVLGLLLWIGYKFVKKSGWRLSRVEASPAVTASETDSVEEKKEEA